MNGTAQPILRPIVPISPLAYSTLDLIVVPCLLWLSLFLYDADHVTGAARRAHVYRTRTKHARFLPAESAHAFAYPGLYLGVDLESLERGDIDLGRLFRWQHPPRWCMLGMRSQAYAHAMQKGDKPGIRHRLLSELSRHGVDVHRLQRVYTISMPSYGPFEGINPLVVHFVYRAQDCRLAVVVLEVHNTFEERHLYVLECGVEEERAVTPSFEHQWTFPRSFHVSPFNDRSGFYRVSVCDPLATGAHDHDRVPPAAQLKIKIVLLTDGEKPRKKLLATLEGSGAPMTANTLLAALWLTPFSLLLTTPRILFEAFRLHYRRKLDVYPRPDLYSADKAGEVNPVARGAPAGSVFWQVATSADVYARTVVEDHLAQRAVALAVRVVLQPEDRALSVRTFGNSGRELIVTYSSPTVFSDLLMAPSPQLALALADGRWRACPEELFVLVFSPSSTSAPQSRTTRAARSLRHAHIRWLWSFAPQVDLPSLTERHAFDQAADMSLVSHLLWRIVGERLGYYIFKLLGARFVAGTEPWAVLARSAVNDTTPLTERVRLLGQGLGSVRRSTER